MFQHLGRSSDCTAKALEEQHMLKSLEEQAMPPHKRPKTVAQETLLRQQRKKLALAKKIAAAKGTEKKEKK